MPTGHTAAIADGITFEQYALNCARAFGALILMRDEPGDAPIPERFEPSPYYDENLTKAIAKLRQLEAMSYEDAESEASLQVEKETASRTELLADRAALRKKYIAMLARVDAWMPPSPDHVEYKAFMRSQIESSMSDCDTDCYDRNPVMQLNGPAWRAQQIEKARKDIAYYAKNRAEEHDRTESRNRWIAALRESLKPATVTP